jgi:hypothetical protein
MSYLLFSWHNLPPPYSSDTDSLLLLYGMLITTNRTELRHAVTLTLTPAALHVPIPYTILELSRSLLAIRLDHDLFSILLKHAKVSLSSTCIFISSIAREKGSI